MKCPFCCFLQDYYIGQFVNIGFVVNCCLDNATPPVNHVYGAGFLRKSSFCGDSIRLYDAPKGGNVIFTGLCENIFELHFPQFGTDNEPLDIDEFKTMVEERQLQKEEIANE